MGTINFNLIKRKLYKYRPREDKESTYIVSYQKKEREENYINTLITISTPGLLIYAGL